MQTSHAAPIRRVGFIGLGIMGSPMACNLAKAGFEVTVHNRDPRKTQDAARAGAHVAETIALAAAGQDAVILMLAHDQAVEEVLYNQGGVVDSASEGTLVIDSSTVHPLTSQRNAVRLAERGLAFLDAPVTGSRPQATDAKLMFLVGGHKSDVARAQPLFNVMGRKAVHLGPNGSGSAAKLVNNMMALINLAGFCESMAIGKRFGLDPAQVYGIISESGGRSLMSELKGPKVLGSEFSPDFALELAHKDVALGKAWSDDIGQYAPMIKAAEQVFGEAKPGSPKDDMSSLYRWYVEGSHEA